MFISRCVTYQNCKIGLDKIDETINRWMFHGETVSPNKIIKLGRVNPTSAMKYVRSEVPRYVGPGKRVRRVRDYWGYEGIGPLKFKIDMD